MSVIKKLFAGAVLSAGLLIMSASAFAAGLPDATATGASVTSTSATLQASIEPNGAQTEYWIEYGAGSNFDRTTNHYSVSGTSGSVAVSQTVTNLSSSTSYSYRVKAQNSNGTAISNIKSFTTSGSSVSTDTPDAVATSASVTGQNSATLYGTVDANNLSTTYRFEYGVGNFGSSVNGGTVSGNYAQSVNASVSGLSAGTTYQFRISATNSEGTSYSNIKTFTTSSGSTSPETDTPDAVATSASVTGQNSATLYGTVDANNLSTTYRFEYGVGNFGSSVNGGTVSGNYAQSVNASVSGLSAGTTYQFRISATNSEGTSYSNIKTFTTSSGNGGSTETNEPEATATGATSIHQYNAYLNGSINPNGLSTDVWFQYGTNSSFQYSTSRSAIGSGYNTVSENRQVTGLSSNTTYQYRVVAENSKGISYSNVKTFTTSYNDNGNDDDDNGNNNYSNGWMPSAITYRSENVTQTTADVFGRVNPNGSYTEYWFEYGIGDTMDRKTSRWHLNPMSGETNVSLMIGNLNPGTTYKFRLMASNGYGTDDGSVISFTTLSNGGSYGTNQLPVATTFAASDISQNVAIFHSKVNPMGGATSVWFEYGTSAGNLSLRTMAQNMGGEYAYRNFAGVVTGLSSGTTYFFRVGAANNKGTVYGEVMSFRTASYTYRPVTPVTVIVEPSDPTVEGAEIMLDPSISLLEPSIGDNLDYTLTYRNASKAKITNVVIKVSLPMEVEYLDANVKPSSRSGNNLTFTIGDVAKNSQGIITIKVKIKDDVAGGSSVMFNSFMEYTDAAKKFQTIDSYIGVIVKGGVEDPNNGGFLGSLAAFAAALSGSWILILLLALILIALIYLIVSRRKDARNS